MAATEIKDVWNQLKNERTTENKGAFKRIRLIPDSNVDCYLVIDVRNKLPALMLSINEKHSIPESMPRSHGIEMHCLAIPSELGEEQTLLLLLKNSEAIDLFLQLCQDILERLKEAKNSELAANYFITRVRQWQRFMEKSSIAGLTVDEQTGLYTELWMIRYFLLSRREEFKIDCWTGPDRANQDFLFPTASIEVKGCLQNGLQELMISNEQQLQVPAGTALFLFWLSLDRRKSQGETLCDLVKDIKAILKLDLQLISFEEKLERAGYFEDQNHLYQQYGFEVREQKFFQVIDEFPRITESDLRQGVANVKYTINVAACAKYEIESKRVTETIWP